MGSICFFFCLEKGVWHFEFTGRNFPFWNIENILPPEVTLPSRTRLGSIWYSFNFIVSSEGCLTSSIYWRKFAFLKSWKLSPQGTLRKQNPYGVHLIFFPFYCFQRRMYDTFNLLTVTRLFKILKMFNPQKGLCESRTSMGSIWYSFHFIVV